MHNETTKALYDFYSLGEKNDFFPAYIYLKYIYQFTAKMIQSIGMPTKKLPFELEDGLD